METASSTPRRRGRPRKPYVTTWGEHVNGLRRRSTDGRWVVVATGEMYTQPDERMAVATFQRKTGNQSITISAPMREVGRKVSDPKKLDGEFRDDTARAAYAALLAVEQLGDNVGATFSTDESPDEWQMTLQAHEPLIWAWVAQQIRTRPEYVAKATGIEQIGYLVDLKKPERPATFAEIEDKWETRYTKTGKRKVLNHWREFVRVTGVTCLREITEQVAVDYRDHVYTLKLTPKMESNIFTRIRHILTFADQQLLKGCGPAIHALRHLKPSDVTTSLDPTPIEVADWKKLHEKATGDDLAMILLMINGGYYLEEVRRLKWNMIKNGAIVTHRRKEGRCVRACVLWPETVAALDKVKRKGEYIFLNYAGAPLGIKGAELRFRELRKLAGVPHVSASHLRDGAATAMAEANVSEKVSNILMGHRNSGVSDHYVKRNPKIVVPACAAVYAAYFGKALKQKAA